LAQGLQQDELARQVGVSPRTVGRWENGKSQPNAGNIISLKRVLNYLSDETIFEAFGIIRAKGKYRAYSLASAKALCGSYKKLDAELGRIEDEFPVPTVPGEYGTEEKWIELLELCADSGGVVALTNDEIVGYWTRTLILQDFFDFLREVAESEIYFDKIVANITGVEARQICENLNFRKIIDHPIHKYPEHVGRASEIFEMDVKKDGERFFASDKELSKLYSNRGLY